MRKFTLGSVAILLLLAAVGPLAEAGQRRISRRAVCSPQCVPQPVPCCQPTCPAPVNQQPAGAPSSATLGTFPDICPQEPIFEISDPIWVWSAIRNYGAGLNCSNCLTEATALIGDYDIGSMNWPYPCGDDMCEPDTTLAARAIPYGGVKGGRPVNFDYSPVSDMRSQSRAQEILPRAYFSFEDKSSSPRTHYFIAYHIKTARAQFTIAHEVDQKMLEEHGVSIHPLPANEVSPADHLGRAGTEHSFVYLHKPEGKMSDIVFFLKK